MSLPQDIIARKRDGHALSKDDITTFVAGLTDQSVSDAQAGAFAMAVLLNGMTVEERVAMTLAMRDSGKTLQWDLPGPVLDKHSTGGVGDCVSLVLAPALAACGAYVPMISGRGLGHTGGTLDKLDAIEGYSSDVGEAKFRQVVSKIGCAIVGQTAQLAPADKRMYAIRDISGTVDSIDLICASILSKKLAAGLGSLVLDIKCGNGAVAKDINTARDLAKALVDVANGAGCKTRAVITDMNEPLCSAAGNALEVAQSVRLLTGTEIDARLWDVTICLGGMALAQAGIAVTQETGEDKIAQALQSGAAAECFGKMVAALGGPTDLLENADRALPNATIVEEVYAETSGFVAQIDTTALGRTVVALGGGRSAPDQTLDYSVGLDWILGTGLLVDNETPLARVHARTADEAKQAASAVRAAFQITPVPPEETSLILDQL